MGFGSGHGHSAMSSWWHYWHAHLPHASQSIPQLHKTFWRAQAFINTKQAQSGLALENGGPTSSYSCTVILTGETVPLVGCQVKKKSLHVHLSLTVEVPSFNFRLGKQGSKHLPFSSVSATPLWWLCSLHCSKPTRPCQMHRLHSSLLPMEAELFEQTGPIWHFSLRNIILKHIYV